MNFCYTLFVKEILVSIYIPFNRKNWYKSKRSFIELNTEVNKYS